MYHKAVSEPRLPVSLCACLAALVAAACAAAAGPQPRLVEAGRLGTLRVGPATTAGQAARYLRRLGAPPRELRLGGECALYAPEAGVGVEPCSGSGVRISVTGTRWHTGRGVRVGTSLPTLRHAYPHADDSGLERGGPGVRGWVASWELAGSTPGSHAMHPELFAETRAGRVVALAIEMVGH
jgi:hypothetical protein